MKIQGGVGLTGQRDLTGLLWQMVLLGRVVGLGAVVERSAKSRIPSEYGKLSRV